MQARVDRFGPIRRDAMKVATFARRNTQLRVVWTYEVRTSPDPMAPWHSRRFHRADQAVPALET